MLPSFFSIAPLPLAATMANVKIIADIIFGGIVAIIAIPGILFGVHQWWEGNTGDRPEEKRKGLSIIIVTVVAIVLLFLVQAPMYSLAGV